MLQKEVRHREEQTGAYQVIFAGICPAQDPVTRKEMVVPLNLIALEQDEETTFLSLHLASPGASAAS